MSAWCRSQARLNSWSCNDTTLTMHVQSAKRNKQIPKKSFIYVFTIVHQSLINCNSAFYNRGGKKKHVLPYFWGSHLRSALYFEASFVSLHQPCWPGESRASWRSSWPYFKVNMPRACSGPDKESGIPNKLTAEYALKANCIPALSSTLCESSIIMPLMPWYLHTMNRLWSSVYLYAIVSQKLLSGRPTWKHLLSLLEFVKRVSSLRVAWNISGSVARWEACKGWSRKLGEARTSNTYDPVLHV